MPASQCMSTNDPAVGTVQFDDRGTGPLDAVPHLGARSVVAVFDRFEDADAAASELQQEGFPADRISVVRGPSGTPPAIPASETHAGAGAATGAAAGAVIGGAIVLGALALTGIGAVLAAGPIAAAIGGVVTGGAMGALAGSLTGLGMTSDRAKMYEDAVRAGGILVAVTAEDHDRGDHARAVLVRHGARDVESFNPTL